MAGFACQESGRSSPLSFLLFALQRSFVSSFAPKMKEKTALAACIRWVKK